jgi:hypothetical protein
MTYINRVNTDSLFVLFTTLVVRGMIRAKENHPMLIPQSLEQYFALLGCIMAVSADRSAEVKSVRARREKENFGN